MYELMVESTFCGAHQLLKSNSPCENLHGHNWKVQLILRQENLDSTVGWVMDFKKIKTELNNELDKYDHHNLNEIIAVSPTAENLAKLIYTNLKKIMPVYKVIIWETAHACAAYFED